MKTNLAALLTLVHYSTSTSNYSNYKSKLQKAKIYELIHINSLIEKKKTWLLAKTLTNLVLIVVQNLYFCYLNSNCNYIFYNLTIKSTAK